jgi:hypothetical protein
LLIAGCHWFAAGGLRATQYGIRAMTAEELIVLSLKMSDTGSELSAREIGLRNSPVWRAW